LADSQVVDTHFGSLFQWVPQIQGGLWHSFMVCTVQGVFRSSGT
jgi:hypothetical protein